MVNLITIFRAGTTRHELLGQIRPDYHRLVSRKHASSQGAESEREHPQENRKGKHNSRI